MQFIVGTDLTDWGTPERKVSCSFFRLTKAHGIELEKHDMRVPTSMAGTTNALRLACTDFATDRGCQLWAQPDLAREDGTWLVFAPERQVAVLRVRAPTRDAAEMWMVHHG